jgi:hypothetical protein
MMAEHVAGFGGATKDRGGVGVASGKGRRWVVLVGGGGLLGFHG